MSLSPNFQPLYKQVYDLMTAKLVNGELKPSEALPSEQALAVELNVSQGTVRKALDLMVAENLLERRQGKGTFVSEFTQESSLFRFFHFKEPSGSHLIPESEVISVKRRACTSIEAKHLDLKSKEKVVELYRVRTLKKKPVIVERIIQPLAIFPDIDKIVDLPNSLYTLYQDKFSISIVEVREELRAVNLPERYAKHLEMDANEPVLLVERASVNIDGRVVEWSEAFCKTEDFVYSVNLR